MKNNSDNLVVHFVLLQIPTVLSMEPNFELSMTERKAWQILAPTTKQNWDRLKVWVLGVLGEEGGVLALTRGSALVSIYEVGRAVGEPLCKL